jgi:T4 RnlA family RNA ligase
MVTPVLCADGSVKMKTKKTFTSNEAITATQLLHAVDNGQVELEWVKKVLSMGFTPTFEFTSPRFPIVIKYDKEELTLLHVRENASGRYLTEGELVALVPPFPIVTNLIEHFKVGIGGGFSRVDWDLLKEAQETMEGLEGWVIQFKDGNMVKLKTKWYSELHHAVTFTRWRDIARVVCEDKSDDLKGAFAMTGRSIEPILQVERWISGQINLSRGAAVMHAEAGIKYGKTAKEMAMLNKDHPLFGQIMRIFRGQEVDWMDWYVKNRLDDDWSLEVVAVDVPDWSLEVVEVNA